MSIARIEAEFNQLSLEDLRQLAIRSWAAFLEKEGSAPLEHACDENDPALLAALDDAVRRADSSASRPVSGDEVRSRILRWTSK